MGIKIVIDRNKRTLELQERGIKKMLRAHPDPNIPGLSHYGVALTRISCGSCGTKTWAPLDQWECDDCLTLEKAEHELELALHRKEREVRLREVEKKLAELD